MLNHPQTGPASSGSHDDRHQSHWMPTALKAPMTKPLHFDPHRAGQTSARGGGYHSNQSSPGRIVDIGKDEAYRRGRHSSGHEPTSVVTG